MADLNTDATVAKVASLTGTTSDPNVHLGVAKALVAAVNSPGIAKALADVDIAQIMQDFFSGKQPWYKSRCIWGAVVGGLCAIAHGIYGVTVDPVMQVEIVNDVLNATALLGSIAAVYYRVKATHVISSTAQLPAVPVQSPAKDAQ